jgi:3-oxoacyl-[acyl-carrier protein] reductase
VRFDVADTQAGAAAVEEVVKSHGRMTCGEQRRIAIDGPGGADQDDDWDRQLDTNLKGLALPRRGAV